VTPGQDLARATGNPTRVLLVDDNPDITDVLCHVVGTEPAMECVGCLQSVDHLLEEVRRLRPDVLVLDARMPGKDPLKAMLECTAEFTDLKTIFHSGFDDPDFIDQLIDAGAWGFVSKHHDPGTLVRAIRSVSEGRVAFVRSRSGSAQPPAGP
jgi:DNA-binding NarL/FixJ family response regulator